MAFALPMVERREGKFYIEDRRDSTVFKFTPAQKLKAILGWANTYRGDIE